MDWIRYWGINAHRAFMRTWRVVVDSKVAAIARNGVVLILTIIAVYFLLRPSLALIGLQFNPIGSVWTRALWVVAYLAVVLLLFCAYFVIELLFVTPYVLWREKGQLIGSLVAERAVAVGSPTKHDVQLLEAFRTLLSESEKRFLQDHDLGGTFSWNCLTGTKKLSEDWTGAEFEFDDKDVQARFAPIVLAAREFMAKLAFGSDITQIDGLWASTVPKAERGSEISDKTLTDIKAHNDRATALIGDINGFIRYARPRIER